MNVNSRNIDGNVVGSTHNYKLVFEFLDGTKYTASKNIQHQTADTTVVMDTSNMLIVGGGAFLDVSCIEEVCFHRTGANGGYVYVLAFQLRP